jgi:hypothetical protein
VTSYVDGRRKLKKGVWENTEKGRIRVEKSKKESGNRKKVRFS